MNTMEQELENTLRTAPRPIPPVGLRERLLAQVRLPAGRPAAQKPASPLAPAGWLRRWWPVLVPATVSLACAVGLTVQQAEIRELRQAIQDLSRHGVHKVGGLPPLTVQTNKAAPHADAAARTQQEVARLKELAGQLAAEVAQLEQLSAENAKLRTQLAAPPPGVLSPDETEELAKAKEKAEAIACVNNLKQFALAARIWALANDGVFPPDIPSMRIELSTPKILVCPADRTREAAKDWASYTPAHCSYEYLAPSGSEVDYSRVLSRCPIHGTIGMCDGSVQRATGKYRPERLVQRGGKLYVPDHGEPTQGSPAPQPTNPPPGGSHP